MNECKYIDQCNYHVHINSYYKFAIRFGIRRQLFVNTLLHTIIYTGKIWIIKIIQKIYKQRWRLYSFVVLCFSYTKRCQHGVNFSCSRFYTIKNTFERCLHSYIYTYMCLNGRTQFLLSIIYLIFLSGIRLPYSLIKTFWLILVWLLRLRVRIPLER